jgi:hypothetical protein
VCGRFFVPGIKLNDVLKDTLKSQKNLCSLWQRIKLYLAKFARVFVGPFLALIDGYVF